MLDLLVAFVEFFLHGLPLQQVLLRALQQNVDLLLVSLDVLLEELDIGGVLVVPVLLALERLFQLLQLPLHDHALRFSFPDLQRVHGVLLVQLNQSLLQLDYLLVSHGDLRLNGLLLDLVQPPLLALAVLVHYSLLLDFLLVGRLGHVLLLLQDVLVRVQHARPLLHVQVRVQLSFQLVNFVPQVSNNVFVSTDVLVDHLLVRLHPHLDVLGSVRVLQRVYCFLVLRRCRTHCCYHDSLAVASQRVLEHPRQLRVSEWNKEPLLGLVSEGIDAVGQGEEGSVDLGSLPQPDPSVLRHRASLRPCQVYQRQLAAHDLVLGVLQFLLGVEHDLEHCVGPGGSLVGIRRLRCSPLVPNLEQTHDLLGLLDHELGHAGQGNAAVLVVPQVQVGLLVVRHQQVPDHLVVDLDVGDFHFELLLGVALHSIEHLLDYQVHYSWLLTSASHGVRLPRTSGAVGEHAGIVALHNRVDERLARVLVDDFGGGGLGENAVEVVPLLARTVQHLRLLPLAFALQLHFVQNYLNCYCIEYKQLVLSSYDIKVTSLLLFLVQRSDSNGHEHVGVSVVFLQELLSLLLVLFLRRV